VEARRRTWFDDRGLKLENGRSLPFYAGAMHYWRVDPSVWATCLRAMHALGLTLVETYVPWRVHDPQGGKHVWTGQRDLGRFLEAAWAAGLSVVLRPGPHVNAELTSFGFPDWVLADPQCQARTAQGSPAWLPVPPRAFPLPSYASTKFHEHVRTWYAALAEIVKPYLAPTGPVVAIGVDNEAQLFFRTGAFDIDYHPDALAWWRDASGLDEPPREWHSNDTARCVLWLKHKDEYIGRALGLFAKALDDVGLGEIARFHNLPPGHYGHYDLRRIQHAIGGPVGIDAYTPRAEFPELRRRVAALAGNASPLPLALEVGVGFFPWFPPLDEPDDTTRERDHLLTLLASGVRGFNLFMAVERDRFYGAAISSAGRVEAPWVKPLVAALAEVDWPSLRRTPVIALVDTRADARIGLASNVLDPMSSALAEILALGPAGAAELGSDVDAIAARRWQAAITRALELAQVPYAIVDEAASEDELARYRAVIAPTRHRIDRGLWQRLRALAEHKRAIVVIGPTTPTRDELDQPLDEPAPKRIGKLNEGSLEDIAGLAEDLGALAGELAEDWTVERPDDVRTMAYADESGAVRVVFVVSDAPKHVTAVVLAGDATSVRDPLAGETLRIEDGRINVAMPARGVRMLIVES
jgi:beta-galactosidase